MNAQGILTRVRAQLADASSLSGFRYSDTLLLSYISLAQRAVVVTKPESNAKAVLYTLPTSSARQRLDPAVYYCVLRVDANVDSSNRPSQTIRTVERDVLDSFDGAWFGVQPTGAVGAKYQLAAMDSADPLAFWLFPQPQAGDTVQLTAAAYPAAITSVSDVLTLSDQYVSPIVEYACHLAVRSEERATSQENTTRFLNAFYALLGVQRQTLRVSSADRARPPEAKE